MGKLDESYQAKLASQDWTPYPATAAKLLKERPALSPSPHPATHTSSPWPLLFIAVLSRVGLCSLARMEGRVRFVSTSRVGVMRGLLIAAGLVMLCFLVVTSRLLVMFCCLQVMPGPLPQ